MLNYGACSGEVSPAEKLLSFQPRTTVNKNLTPGQAMVYKTTLLKKTDPVKCVVQAGKNTVWVNDDKKTFLASVTQLQPIDKSSEHQKLQTFKGWQSHRKVKTPKRLAYQERANVKKTKKK